MNLDELRTPHPLRDADFAAIRARVKAEIAQREERGWLALLLRFAFAAALVVAFVPLTRERVPEVPVQVQKPPQLATHDPKPEARQGVILSPRTMTRVPSRSLWSAEAAPPLSYSRKCESGGAASALHTTTRRTRAAIATRIEIQTADPTIRIIWLTPKENNS
ncbi:MAG TPA: hypothetical protein VGD79_08070 [Thermoanaerobaculia bacterium]